MGSDYLGILLSKMFGKQLSYVLGELSGIMGMESELRTIHDQRAPRIE